MQDFLIRTTNQLEVRDFATRIAIVVYSTKPTAVLKLNELGKGLTQKAVKEKIYQMKHQRGFTFIDKALRLAEREIFTKANGMRRNVPKVFRIIKLK